jgi:hypothetical protein
MALPGQVHQYDPYIDTEGAAVSRARVHNFSISLDGFASGGRPGRRRPVRSRRSRLYEWLLATRFWELLGLLATNAAGTVGVDIEPMSTTVFNGGAVAHVFAAHP